MKQPVFVAEPPAAYRLRPPLVVDCSLLAAVLFDEPGLAWSGVDLTRYDVTPDGQRFLVVQPEPWEIAPFALVVAPRFGQELASRPPG